MSDTKKTMDEAREKMKKSANEAEMTSSKALQDDALTRSDRPLKTDLEG